MNVTALGSAEGSTKGACSKKPAYIRIVCARRVIGEDGRIYFGVVFRERKREGRRTRGVGLVVVTPATLSKKPGRPLSLLVVWDSLILIFVLFGGV